VRRLNERRTPVISSLASLRHTNYSLDKVRSAHRVLSKRDRASRPSSDPSFFRNPLFFLSLTSGEALNIDLSDFTTQLYALIQSLSCSGLTPEIDAASPSSSGRKSAGPPTPSPRGATAATNASASTGAVMVTTTAAATASSAVMTSTSDLLFRALHLAFAPRASVPPWRAAAFAKRLLTAALHWPGSVALRALEFVAKLVAREPRLEALLSTEDCTVDGVYRPDVEDPQLSNPFATSAYELYLLQTAHVDARIRGAATNLANYTRT
jgi:nucleolar complex protein 3